jgi:hypothetical protein
MRIRVICWAPALAALGGLTAAAMAATAGWSIQPTPKPEGTHTSWLYSVSCASANACTAVGGTYRGPLAERWNGRRWRIQRTAWPSGSSQLSGVSCPGARACTAVGVSFSRAGGLPLAEGWNGRRWSIQSTPGTKTGVFSGVSCPPARPCVAVGYEIPHDVDQPLIERWGGGSWDRQPTPDAGPGRLIDVSCTSAQACTAVGTHSAPHARLDAALVERWNGHRWLVQSTPRIKNRNVTLLGVSCTSVSLCTAVGEAQTPPPCESTGCGEQIQTSALVERWDGRRWSLQATPHPVHHGALNAVSCTLGGACAAVGGSRRPLAERSNGRRWTTQHPAGSRRIPAFLQDLVCVSRHLCLAVGGTLGYGPGVIGERALVERWTG